MPGNIIIPPSVMYAGTAYARKSLLLSAPNEGNRLVPLSINWGNDAATLQAVSFNLQSITTLPISQICAIYVNNLMSNVDAVFKFPDIPFQLTVPAQSEGLYPVDTNSLQFVVQAGGGVGTTGDQVFFDVYNFLPPPIAIARAFVTSIVTSTGAALTTSMTQLIAAGTNGIITAASIVAQGVLSGAAAGSWSFVLQDGAGTTLAIGGFGIPTATTGVPFIQLLNLSGVNLAFRNGLSLIGTFSGTAFTSGGTAINIYFR